MGFAEITIHKIINVFLENFPVEDCPLSQPVPSINYDLIQLQMLCKRPKYIHNVIVHGSNTYHYSYSKPV